MGIKHLEIAPSIVWPRRFPSKEEVLKFRSLLNSYNINVISLQALFYERKDFNIFNELNMEEMLNFTSQLIQLCKCLDADILVHGSPGTRQFPPNFMHDYKLGISFFDKISKYCYSNDVRYGIEPLSKKEGCDYINDTSDAIKLMNEIDSRGMVLHIDTKTLILNQEDPALIFDQYLDKIGHMHVSVPGLGKILDYQDDLRAIAKVVRTSGYKKGVSIEMRRQETSNYENVKNSLDFLIEEFQ